MTGATRDPDRYEALDSLRGVAALGVFGLHVACHSNSNLGHLSFFRNGDMFVDFFFVLSGFIIAATYGDRLRRREVSLRQFTIRRFFRLYPLHLCVIVLFIISEFAFYIIEPDLGLFVGATLLSDLRAHLLLLTSMGFTDEFTWNGPSWSISAEFWTYMIFGFSHSSA